MTELRLQAAPATAHHGREAAIAQAVGQPQRRRARGLRRVRHVYAQPFDLGHGRFLALQIEDDPFDAGAEADARRRLATQQLDQAVVASAGADGALAAFFLRLELEDGARVVVEPAHQPRVHGVRDLQRIEVRT